MTGRKRRLPRGQATKRTSHDDSSSRIRVAVSQTDQTVNDPRDSPIQNQKNPYQKAPTNATDGDMIDDNISGARTAPLISGNRIPQAEATAVLASDIASLSLRSLIDQYPKTLVNGVYYSHDPQSLPEPLGQAYRSWLQSQHLEATTPDGLGQRHVVRELQYWRLSTDFSRFKSFPDDEVSAEDSYFMESVSEEAQSTHKRQTNLKSWQLQRPYSAPHFRRTPEPP